MDQTPTPPESSFGLLADSICNGVQRLETRMLDLGDQGPVALEYMLEAATNLRVRLEPDKTSPGSDIPSSVRVRGVRHDFRNLIAAIVGFSELLLLEDELLDDIAVQLRALKKASLVFCDLLDEIRDSAA